MSTTTNRRRSSRSDSPPWRPGGLRSLVRGWSPIEDDLPERLPAELATATATAHADAVACVEGLSATARGVPRRVAPRRRGPPRRTQAGPRRHPHGRLQRRDVDGPPPRPRTTPGPTTRAAACCARRGADPPICRSSATTHVRVNPRSAPRRTRAIAALCVELDSTDTVYPAPGSSSATASRTAEHLRDYCA